jgi:hypothetical protein
MSDTAEQKNESETPNLDRVQEAVDRLHSLLHNREPGCFTWKEALHKELTAVNVVTGEFI